MAQELKLPQNLEFGGRSFRRMVVPRSSHDMSCLGFSLSVCMHISKPCPLLLAAITWQSDDHSQSDDF